MFVSVSLPDLVFAPQKAVVLIIDAGADEVHAVVLNSEVKVSKPEHHPGCVEAEDSSKKQFMNKETKTLKN